MRTSPPEKARVVIAAAPTLFRASLRRVIESEWVSYTVVEAESLPEAANQVSMLRPDVLVFDLGLADNPKPLALRAIASSVPVVVLADKDEIDVAAVRRLGVTLVDKESNVGAFLDAIRCVLLDGQAVSLGPTRRPLSLAPQRRNFNLTPRERQIVAEVAAAHPNKEIARRLNISEQTVKRHVNTVFTKLGVSNRVELTLFATYWGLLHDSQLVQLAGRLGQSSLAG